MVILNFLNMQSFTFCMVYSHSLHVFMQILSQSVNGCEVIANTVQN